MRDIAASKSTGPHRTADRLPDATTDVAQGSQEPPRRTGVTLHRDFPFRSRPLPRCATRLDEQAYMERKTGVAKLGGPNGLTGLIPSVPGDASEPIYQGVDGS